VTEPQTAGCPREFAWGRWIPLYCAFSFLMLGTDAAMNHHLILERRALSWIPLIFAPVAAALCLAAVFSQRWRKLAWLVGLLALAVGGAGTLIHNYLNLAGRGDVTIMGAMLDAMHPSLAPAAFASSGILMLLVWFAERSNRRNQTH